MITSQILPVSPTFVPRVDRDFLRGSLAASKAPGKAIDRAIAHIESTFNEAAVVNKFKLRVERAIRLGTGHPEVQARYRRWCQRLEGASLPVAIIRIDQWHRKERMAFQIASAFGRGSRLDIEVLAEIRLMLRLIRRSEHARNFKGLLAFVANG